MTHDGLWPHLQVATPHSGHTHTYIRLDCEGLRATSESASIEAINSTKATFPVHYLQEEGGEEEREEREGRREEEREEREGRRRGRGEEEREGEERRGGVRGGHEGEGEDNKFVVRCACHSILHVLKSSSHPLPHLKLTRKSRGGKATPTSLPGRGEGHPGTGSPDRVCPCVQCGTQACVCVRTDQTDGTHRPWSCCVACTSQTALPVWPRAQETSCAALWGGTRSRSETPG